MGGVYPDALTIGNSEIRPRQVLYWRIPRRSGLTIGNSEATEAGSVGVYLDAVDEVANATSVDNDHILGNRPRQISATTRA